MLSAAFGDGGRDRVMVCDRACLGVRGVMRIASRIATCGLVYRLVAWSGCMYIYLLHGSKLPCREYILGSTYATHSEYAHVHVHVVVEGSTRAYWEQ